jgi:hypothetical protein
MVWEISGTIISFGSFPACMLPVRNSTFLIFRARRYANNASLSLRYYSTNKYVGFLMTNITQIWDLLDVLNRVRVAFVMKSFTTSATTCALLYLIPFPKIRASKCAFCSSSSIFHRLINWNPQSLAILLL